MNMKICRQCSHLDECEKLASIVEDIRYDSEYCKAHKDLKYVDSDKEVKRK